MQRLLEWWQQVGRRVLLGLCVLGLLFTALVAIAAVLIGSFNDPVIRVLLSALVVVVASLCTLVARSPRLSGGVEVLGRVILSGVWLLAINWLGVIWWQESWFVRDSFGLQLSVGATILVIGGVHSLGLMAVRLPGRLGLMRPFTAGLITVTALLVQVLVFELPASDEAVFKAWAVLSVLIAFGTLLIVILGRESLLWSTTHGSPDAIEHQLPQQLTLTRQADGRYRDHHGDWFLVTAVSTKPEE